MTKKSIQVRLEKHLSTLKLKGLLTVLDQELERVAQEKISPIEWLDRLLSIEVGLAKERRVERFVRESKLPKPLKLLQEFDFDFQTGVDQGQIMSLAQLDFIHRKRSLFFGGQSGTGKSHLAQAILLLACQAGYRCLYTTAADMLRHLKSSLVDDTLDQKLKRYLKPDVLLIDEVGFDQLEQDETRHAGLFFKVVDGRYGKASTLFTTNLDFTQLGEYLGDPTITAALVDRLVHHAVIISIVGPSWRVHESNQLNQIAASS